MKVIYSNGSEGYLNKENSKDLYVRGRLYKTQWQELLNKMNELQIIKFEDEMLKEYNIDMVSINFVKNQIEHLSY